MPRGFNNTFNAEKVGAKNPQYLEKIKRLFLEEFRSGKLTLGKDGSLAPILKHFLEAALEVEMDIHLDSEQREKNNRRNG